MSVPATRWRRWLQIGAFLGLVAWATVHLLDPAPAPTQPGARAELPSAAEMPAPEILTSEEELPTPIDPGRVARALDPTRRGNTPVPTWFKAHLAMIERLRRLGPEARRYVPMLEEVAAKKDDLPSARAMAAIMAIEESRRYVLELARGGGSSKDRRRKWYRRALRTVDRQRADVLILAVRARRDEREGGLPVPIREDLEKVLDALVAGDPGAESEIVRLAREATGSEACLWVRLAAAFDRVSPPTEAAILAAIQDSDVALASTAMKALAGWSGGKCSDKPKFVSALIDCLEPGTRDQRTHALKALHRLNHCTPDLVEALVRALEYESMHSGMATGILAMFGPKARAATPHLLRRLEVVTHRVPTLNALARLGSDEAIAALLSILREGGHGARLEVLAVLPKAPLTAETLEVFSSLVTRGESAPSLLRTLVLLDPKMENETARAILESALSDARPGIRVAAAVHACRLSRVPEAIALGVVDVIATSPDPKTARKLQSWLLRDVKALASDQVFLERLSLLVVQGIPERPASPEDPLWGPCLMRLLLHVDPDRPSMRKALVLHLAVKDVRVRSFALMGLAKIDELREDEIAAVEECRVFDRQAFEMRRADRQLLEARVTVSIGPGSEFPAHGLEAGPFHLSFPESEHGDRGVPDRRAVGSAHRDHEV